MVLAHLVPWKLKYHIPNWNPLDTASCIFEAFGILFAIPLGFRACWYQLDFPSSTPCLFFKNWAFAPRKTWNISGLLPKGGKFEDSHSPKLARRGLEVKWWTCTNDELPLSQQICSYGLSKRKMQQCLLKQDRLARRGRGVPVSFSMNLA